MLGFIALFSSATSSWSQPFRVVSYNVENLFYPTRDTLECNPDTLFTPEGERHWSYTRYYRKIENIARVLTVIGEWDGVDVIGLQEIESAACVKRLCYTLRRNEYDFIHYDSPDRRGIDVALIYKKARFSPISSEVLRVDLGEQTTRDILYVCGEISSAVGQRDTLHLLVCHLPSQLNGKAESEWKRIAAKDVLRSAIDSLYALNEHARIIVMGDMNSRPQEDLLPLRNRMITMQQHGEGTHKWQGQWTCLDQFYTSSALDEAQVRIFAPEWIQEADEKGLGLKPKRCYIGFRYQNGFSDHLPIVLTLGE